MGLRVAAERPRNLSRMLGVGPRTSDHSDTLTELDFRKIKYDFVCSGDFRAVRLHSLHVVKWALSEPVRFK